MQKNKTSKKKGGTIMGKTRIDNLGNVIFQVSNKNKVSNSVDVFEKRNSIVRKYPNFPIHFYGITSTQKEVIIKKEDLLSRTIPQFRSIVYMDQSNNILFPGELGRILSSKDTKVYETEICFLINSFNASSGFLKNVSYSITIYFSRKIREIKIDRGWIYHAIDLFSVMSYDHWKKDQLTVNIDRTYDTFWFNLFPMSEKTISLVMIELSLLNPIEHFKDANEKQVSKLVNDFVDKIYNTSSAEQISLLDRASQET